MGRWNVDEQRQFVKQCRLHGWGNWADFNIPTRDRNKIQDYANKNVKKNNQRLFEELCPPEKREKKDVLWTDERDAIFDERCVRHGWGNWEHFESIPGVTPAQIRTKGKHIKALDHERYKRLCPSGQSASKYAHGGSESSVFTSGPVSQFKTQCAEHGWGNWALFVIIGEDGEQITNAQIESYARFLDDETKQALKNSYTSSSVSIGQRFDRVEVLGEQFKDTSSFSGNSCIYPSCGNGAMHSVGGAYCNGCIYERLVEELGFGHDVDTDTLMGNYNGKFYIVEKTPLGHWMFPFELAIHKDLPPEWENNRRSSWNQCRENASDRAKKRSEERKASKMTLLPASKEFLTEVDVDSEPFFEKLTPNYLWNASKGALRSERSKLRMVSLQANECRGFLMQKFRCPPVLIIIFEEQEGGNYLYCEQSKKYLKVADGTGDYVCTGKGRVMKNADFEKGGVLEGRLDVDFVAVGDEQQSLDGEKHIQAKKRDVNGGMYSVVGAGARVGHSTNEHAVGLLGLRILDLIFTDDPTCAFNSEMSAKRFELFAYTGKNPRDYMVDPNFDDYQLARAYKKRRQQEKAAAAAMELGDAHELEGQEDDDESQIDTDEEDGKPHAKSAEAASMSRDNMVETKERTPRSSQLKFPPELGHQEKSSASASASKSPIPAPSRTDVKTPANANGSMKTHLVTGSNGKHKSSELDSTKKKKKPKKMVQKGLNSFYSKKKTGPNDRVL